ncbi:hypothetical protein B9Z19DRAFT_1071523 [Tuber borchii]|uniref:Uncharacterized protein n=1 Tax=Tuber borchii TaxID=42251 RepID=A0A2T7A847_TUBBO|nr:hypothetical protein B9Z19DRAFT_1071523 [Tuber borchii]
MLNLLSLERERGGLLTVLWCFFLTSVVSSSWSRRIYSLAAAAHTSCPTTCTTVYKIFVINWTDCCMYASAAAAMMGGIYLQPFSLSNELIEIVGQ